jgi:2-polyprenyl-6-methoxyphenol hydroxylase-like FAD-dependent oxidoreductase
MDRADVVIVGGGIGGAALARSLALAGKDVSVLEQTSEFQDRVRGESMHVWGVKEAQELGVFELFVDAGAHLSPVWKQYAEGEGVDAEIPMALLVPGVDGTLNLRHPVACQTLLDAAAAAGATVVRGTREVTLSDGQPVTVSYSHDGDRQQITAPLVVGADGRSSTVRKQAGITLDRQEPIGWIAGLLIDGLDGVPDDHDVMAGDGDRFFVLFHQSRGRARAYLVTGEADRKAFAGPSGTERFLEGCRIGAFPWGEQVAAGTPAGPCATYPGDDTWTATPYAHGVVLIGDAAGHNDPIIGQGLSIAMRDARMVRDLVLDGASSPDDFRPYGEERIERMRRLRLIADVIAVVNVEEGADNRNARRAWLSDRMQSMDPEVFPLLIGSFAGPETIPPELVDEVVLDRIRAA